MQIHKSAFALSGALVIVLIAFNSQVSGQVCSKKSDVVFVVDQSGSITDANPKNGSWDNWVLIQDFICQMIKSMNVSYDGTHVGLVTFGNIAVVRFYLLDYLNTNDLCNAVNSIKPGQGTTNLYAGLNTARTQVLSPSNGARPDVTKLFVLITDGKPTENTEKTPAEIQACFDDGILIFAIGITDQVDETQLKSSSSSPQIKGQNYWVTPEFTQLSSVVSSVQNATCNPPKTNYADCAVMDLAFVVDMAQTQTDWARQRGFIKQYIMENLYIGINQVRVAIVTYDSNNANVRIALSRYSAEEDLKYAVDQIPYASSGNADVTKALNMLIQSVFAGPPRSGANLVTVLMMDNKPPNSNQAVDASKRLQALGVRVIAMDMTGDVGLTTLRSLASRVSDVISTAGYSYLNSKLGNLASIMCQNTTGVSCPMVADIVLILDQSTSIVSGQPNYDNWDKQILGFALSLAQAFEIGPNDTQMAVIKFSNVATPAIYFKDAPTSDLLQSQIKNLTIGGGETNITGALYKTRTIMFSPSNGARQNVAHIAILMTDGNANRDAAQTIPEANLTKKAGIEIFTVGITSNINVDQLQAICTSPSETHYFYVDDFNQLSLIIENVIAKSCITTTTQSTKPTTYTTTPTTTFTTSSATTSSTILTTTTTTTPTTTLTTTAIPTTPTTPTTTSTTTTTPTTTSATTPTTSSTATTPTTTSTPTSTTTTPTTTSTSTTPTTTSTTISSSTSPQINIGLSTRNPNDSGQTTGDCPGMADIAFVIDKTTNVNYDNYLNYMLELASYTTGKLNLDGGQGRVALETFSESPNVEFYFDDFTSTKNATSAIKRASYGGSNANLADAIRLLRTEIFTPASGMRTESNVSKVAVILTDNVSTNMTATLAEAQKARDAGINFVVIGIGTYLNPYELSAIASFPFSNNLFIVNSVRNVLDLKDQIVGIVCNKNGTCASRSQPCGSGTCINSFNRVSCICPSGNTGPTCSSNCAKAVDVVFAIDESRSIGLSGFQNMTNFVTSVVQNLRIDSNNDPSPVSRVGVVTYGTTAQTQFELDAYDSMAKLLQAINVPFVADSQANLAQAISNANDMLQSGARTDIPKVLVILSDGPSMNATESWKESLAARANGISILTLGIGPYARVPELVSVASAPDTSNVILVPNTWSFDDAMVKTVSSMICMNAMPCTSNPCMNGAKCTAVMGGYTCGPCPTGYSGTNCERKCSGKIDLVFMLDSAGTVHYERFQNLTNFAISIVNKMNIGQTETRVGLVYWSGDGYVGFYLNQYSTKQDIVEAIRNTPYIGNKTNTAAAFRVLRRMILTESNGDRSDADNFVIFLANGESTVDPSLTIAEAIQSRLNGNHMITVGVEQQMYKSLELEAITSFPRESNSFYAPTFVSLPNLTDTVIAATCYSQDYCQSNPCQNGGSCVSGYGQYTCDCPQSFAGINCQRSCSRQMDIILVLDSSGSVEDEYRKSVAFARACVTGLDVNSGNVRVGAIDFSTSINGQFFLNQNIGRSAAILSSLDFYSVDGGTTNTPLALTEVRDKHFVTSRGDRPGVDNLVIIFTDGYSNVNPDQTIPLSKELKDNGVQFYCVAVGESPQMSELNAMASSPIADHIVALTNNSDINTVANALLDKICSN